MKLKIALVSLALLMALCLTASACVVCPTGYPVQNGGFKYAGLPITLTAPAGQQYQWSMVVQGSTTPIDLGTGSSVTVTPTAAMCGKEIAIYVTAKNVYGDLQCIWMKCIWFYVKCVQCPCLDDFCEGHASDANANKFLPTLPAGLTYTWTINGNALDTTSTATVKAALNALTAGAEPGTQYTAVMTVPESGQICTKTFMVRPQPAGDISVS